MPDQSYNSELASIFEGYGDISLSQVEQLLLNGADPNVITSDCLPVLSVAAAMDDVSLAETLLTHGADPNKQSEDQFKETSATHCCSHEMASLLMRYGANPNNFEDDPMSGNLFPFQTGAWKLPKLSISEQDFTEQAVPRFGRSNPEPCLPDFWSEQIRTNRSGFEAESDCIGRSRSGKHPPVWSFQRHGRSITPLMDGRLVIVAGEHEDHYDPDFFIYNDVTVISADGSVDHYTYPREVFPPTDFHSATLFDGKIVLIGSLGNAADYAPPKTQVLALSLENFSITELETTGINPGWIHKHKAVLEDTSIRVSGGIRVADDKKQLVPLDDGAEFILDLQTLNWRQ
jgi:hypothetical protein